MDILLYLIIITIGIIIGSRDLLKESIVRRLDKIQTFSLLLLLFIMGISIGMDKEVILSFGIIGGQALVLAVCSIIFSVLAVKTVSKYIIVLEEEKDQSDY